MRQVGHFINGKRVDGESGRTGDVFDPNTGEVQAKVALASRAEVSKAVDVAAKAQRAWAAENPQKRARVMMRFLEVIRGEAEELARGAWTSSQLDGRPADEARAATVVIEALLRLDATGDAADVYEEIAPIVDETTQPAVRIELGLAEARWRDRQGNRQRAMDRLAELDREARSHGLLALARDVRRTADALGS